MPRRKQRWTVGDTFVVRLADAPLVPGHIVAHEPQVLNSVNCASFRSRVHGSALDNLAPHVTPDELIACLLTTRDLLDSGEWVIVGRASVRIPDDLLPYELTRGKGWVGAKVFGSSNVVSFLNAFHGLAAWDDWADPLYLDTLLIHPSKKPTNLVRTSTA